MVMGGFAFGVDKGNQFPHASFSEFENAHPPESREGQADVSAPGFSTEVVFSGKSRSLPPAKRKFLDSLLAMEPENRAMFSIYQREIEVRQEGKVIWIPVQKQLVSLMKKELKPGESIVLYIRYFGRMDSEPFYLAVHYSHDNVLSGEEKWRNSK